MASSGKQVAKRKAARTLDAEEAHNMVKHGFATMVCAPHGRPMLDATKPHVGCVRCVGERKAIGNAMLDAECTSVSDVCRKAEVLAAAPGAVRLQLAIRRRGELVPYMELEVVAGEGHPPVFFASATAAEKAFQALADEIDKA